MKTELRHRLIHLFPDDTVAATPVQTMTVHTARGTMAAVHILCNDLPIGQTLRLRVTLQGRPLGKAHWFRLVDVPVEQNTHPVFGLERDGQINPDVIRRAPFRIYDPMAPIPSTLKVTAATMAFRLHIPVPAEAQPGQRTATIEVAAGGEQQMLTLQIDVHGATVPPAGPDSFPYTNWCDFGQMATRHGLAPWSPGHWQMIRRYARLMAAVRQNTILLPLATFMDGETVNEAKLKRLVQLFTNEGFHWIEGGHVDRICPKDVAPESVAGHAKIARVLRQLQQAIVRNGWEDRWLQHVKDEPRGEACAGYRNLEGLVRKYMPGIRVIDAIMDRSLVGTANIWVIQNDEVRNDLPHFQAQREFGDSVWLYTCMGPGGKGLNRLLDMELIRCTVIGWACMACRFDGFLHWGLNQYPTNQDPLARSITDNGLPAGDTHAVYPGPDGPWSSVRLEAHREGLEDLELLRRLKARNSRSCDHITRSVVRDCWDYETAVGALEQARLSLFKATEKGL